MKVTLVVMILAVLISSAVGQTGEKPSRNSGTEAQPQTGGSSLRDRSKVPHQSIQYRNTRLGFTYLLPRTWKGYSIRESKWESCPGVAPLERGPEVTIRHPEWTSGHPRQDIVVLAFTLQQWRAVKQGSLCMGAASVGPSEYGRNGRYVFAEPARDLDENLAGYEEVVRILHGPPLRAFRPRALDRR